MINSRIPLLQLLIFCFLFLGFSTKTFAQIPASLMENCNQWKITYPTGDEDKTLCNEPNNEYFYVNANGDAIVFRVPIRSNNGTTPNSSYIRSELREREPDGSKDVYWTTEGKHEIYVKQAITHLPINKPHLVATQIHGNKDDGIDDSMVLRLENAHLFLSFNGGKLRDDLTIKTNYVLGTKHEVIFVVEDGKHYCYYAEDGNLLNAYKNGTADSYLIKDGGNDYVMDLNYDETYFKIGNYTQSNAEKEGSDTDKANNYGEVLVYDFSVTHDEIAVTGVTLNPSSLNLSLSNKYQLNESVLPANATNKAVSFSSSNTAIAEVNSSGIVTPKSVGVATITVSTDEGNFKATSIVTVVENATKPNLALNKSVVGTGTHHQENDVSNLVDGLTNTRWSVSGFPQSAIVDLGDIYSIERTELVCYSDRAYQFNISISNTENGVFTKIVDRENNSKSGTEESPIIDIFSPVEARFVKITTNGADKYTGSWVSLLELRVFEASPLNIDSNFLEAEKVLLWPNPTSKTINISSEKYFNSIAIYDSVGKLITNQSFKGDVIDISYLNPGLYIFKFNDENSTIVKKVIKK